LIISREEPWRADWGRTGTLSHIRTYNFTSGYGLEPGNYRVVIDLRDFASARVEASFVIEGNVGPRLSNLRFATSGNGTPATQFAEGTEEVFAIFDYSSIPLRAQMRRRWWRNDALIVDRTEAWDFDRYGTSGTVRDISLFDRINGLSSGEYDVEITIVGQPGVIVTGSFVIQDAPVPDPVFNSLSFGTTPTSTAQTNFEAGVTEVFARWSFANIPDGANLELKWFHDEALVHTDSTTWDQGASGNYASAISDASGLAAGNWRVAISLNGYPTASLEGSFTVAVAVTPALSNLELSVTPGGPTETTFPPDVGNLYAQFDFADVPQGTEVVANLVSTDAGIDVRLSGSWTYVTTGRVTDLWIGDPMQPLPPGSYGLVIELPEYGTETSTAFTIEPTPGGEFDPASVGYSVPPQLDGSAPPDIPPQGIWTDAE
jgi:hypothetical protein